MEQNLKRKLVAIMFTDIVDYTAQMSKDEDKAFSLIKKKRNLLSPLLKKYKGTLIKEIGDGTLSRYFKADYAIDCATQFQSKTDTELNIRAGIHMGKVIIDKEDVFGDVVNIASRLESLAIPGSIFVSKETIDKLELSNKVELVPLGMQSLKGVGRLIEVFAIKNEGLVVPSPSMYNKNRIKIHSDKNIPSIAILPFSNKGEEKNAFYAFSIYSDLLSDIISSGKIRVPPKKEIENLQKYSFEKISKELDVQYIVTGDLWKIEDTFQLSIEIYDAEKKNIIWSDRWEEKWNNLQFIKDDLCDSILKILNIKRKIEKTYFNTNTKAYELYLEAQHLFKKRTNIKQIENCKKILKESISLDSDLLESQDFLGIIYYSIGEYDKAFDIFKNALKKSKKLKSFKNTSSLLLSISLINLIKGNKKLAISNTNKALKLNKENNNYDGMVESLNNLGVIHCQSRNYKKGLRYYKDSLKICKEIKDKYGLSTILHNIGNILQVDNRHKEALEYFSKSIKFIESKKHTNHYSLAGIYRSIAKVYIKDKKYKEAIEYNNKSILIRKRLNDKKGLAYSYNLLGEILWSKMEHNKAMNAYKRCLRISKEIGLKSHMIRALENISYIYYEIGNYEKSLKNRLLLLELAEKWDNKFILRQVYNNLSILYATLGNLKKAIIYSYKSLKIAKKLNDKNNISKQLYNIGYLNFIAKKYDDSISYIKQSLEITDQYKNEGLLFLHFNYKNLNKKHNLPNIHALIKKLRTKDALLNYHIYKLINNKEYLKKAYEETIKKLNIINNKNLKGQFKRISPNRSIIEEYNKVFK